MVDQEMHDRFGNLIGDGLSYDVEVRRDQTSDEFSLHGFAFGERRFVRIWLMSWLVVGVPTERM